MTNTSQQPEPLPTWDDPDANRLAEQIAQANAAYGITWDAARWQAWYSRNFATAA